MKDFLNFIKDYPAFIGIIAIFFSIIGIFIGNWLATGRDKRHEFNELIDSIRFPLLGERDNPGNFNSPSRVTLLKIREYLHCWKRGGFDQAIEAYNKSKDAENRQPDGLGGFYIIDKALIAHAANNLLKFLKPR